MLIYRKSCARVRASLRADDAAYGKGQMISGLGISDMAEGFLAPAWKRAKERDQPVGSRASSEDETGADDHIYPAGDGLTCSIHCHR